MSVQCVFVHRKINLSPSTHTHTVLTFAQQLTVNLITIRDKTHKQLVFFQTFFHHSVFWHMLPENSSSSPPLTLHPSKLSFSPSSPAGQRRFPADSQQVHGGPRHGVLWDSETSRSPSLCEEPRTAAAAWTAAAAAEGKGRTINKIKIYYIWWICAKCQSGKSHKHSFVWWICFRFVCFFLIIVYAHYQFWCFVLFFCSSLLGLGFLMKAPPLLKRSPMAAFSSNPSSTRLTALSTTSFSEENPLLERWAGWHSLTFFDQQSWRW